MKSATGITTKIIAIIAAIIVALSFSSPAEVYADGVEWGYGNPSKGVIWVLDSNGTMTVYLNDDNELRELVRAGSLAGFPDDLPAPETDEEMAVTQLFKNTGTEKNDSYRKESNNKLLFTDNGVLAGKVKKLVFKEGIKGVGWKAKWDDNAYDPPYDDSYKKDRLNTGVFQDFTQLETVETCSSIQRIGWSAFRRCSALKSIDFGTMTNLQEIMNQAFTLTGLEKVDMSGCKKLETIRFSAFSENEATADDQHHISEVILPDSLKEIGDKAFWSCSNLEYVKFGDTSKLTLVGLQAFQGKSSKIRTKLEYVTDEATSRKAVVLKAIPKLFNDNVLKPERNYPDRPDNVFWYGAMPTDLWDLDVTVKEKTADYNGEEQYGYEVKDVSGTGGDTCTVSGLKDGHVLSMTSAESDTGYKPSHGTEPGKYTNGAFKTDKPGIKAMYEGYDYGINYVLGTTAAGALTIRPVVTFVNYNDEVLSKTAYDKGTAAGDIIRPTDPVRPQDEQYTYTFVGWEPDIVDVTGNATYKAKYKATVREYNVKFVNDDGTVLQDTKEKYGSTPSYKGSTPTKPEDDKYTYTFKGWKPAVSEVTGPATYTAEFTATAKPEPEPEPEPDQKPSRKRRSTPASGTTQRPAAGGNNVTPAAPADDGTVVPDAPVPQADPEDAEIIPDEPVPQTEPDVETGAWALLNLIMAILTVIGAILAILRRREDEDDDSSRLLILAAKIVSIIVAILAPIIFFLTEDMTLPMTMTDRFTWLMALILAIQIAAAVVIKRASEAYEDDEE